MRILFPVLTGVERHRQVHFQFVKKIEEIMSDFLANENEEAMLEIREFLDDNDVVTGSNVVNLKDELSQTKDLIGGDVGNNIGSY